MVIGDASLGQPNRTTSIKRTRWPTVSISRSVRLKPFTPSAKSIARNHYEIPSKFREANPAFSTPTRSSLLYSFSSINWQTRAFKNQLTPSKARLSWVNRKYRELRSDPSLLWSPNTCVRGTFKLIRFSMFLREKIQEQTKKTLTNVSHSASTSLFIFHAYIRHLSTFVVFRNYFGDLPSVYQLAAWSIKFVRTRACFVRRIVAFVRCTGVSRNIYTLRRQ